MITETSHCGVSFHIVMMRHDITSLRDKKTIGRVAEIISFVNEIIREVSEIVSFVNEIIRKVSGIDSFVNEIIRKGARLEKKASAKTRTGGEGCRSASFRRQFFLLSC